MKAKKIAKILLLVGSVQAFALTKDIPSMRPNEIVKLNYASLTPAEQDNLWFTAMFAGLEGTRSAAKQVIKKNFPAVKWDNIEQIALSAKQSNKIDDGIAQAKTAVAVRVPSAVGASSIEAKPTVEAMPAGNVIKPSITELPASSISAHTTWLVDASKEKKLQAIEQVVAPAHFTQTQIAAINTALRAINAIDVHIKEFLPNVPSEDYDALRQSLGEEPSFDEVMNVLQKRKEGLQVILRALKSEEAKLGETLLGIQKLVPQLKNLDSEYYMFVGSSPKMSLYDDFKDNIMHVRSIHGVKEALVDAQAIKNRLVVDLAKLKKLKAKTDIVSASLPEDRVKILLKLAEELDAKTLKAKEYDSTYKDYTEDSFKQLADRLVQQEDDENDIVNQIETLIAQFRKNMELLAQLEQKRNEYGTQVVQVEKKIAALADKAPQPVPYFDEILKAQGLKEAAKILQEYQKKLDALRSS